MSDRESFESLYTAHAGAVRAYALRRGPAEEADDVVAEVFTVAWRRLGDVPADPRGWLLGVARRVQSNARRGSARRRALRARLEHERPARAGEADAGRIAEALLRLRDRDREALLLVAWEGLSNRQAARAVGVSEGAFDVRLHRARARLARALGEAAGEEPRSAPARRQTPTRTEVR